ncbi:hypothetical protein [Methylomicrobium agile]|uniref:hypothetical protein n=2 Tax=Methylomicrobium agile TaxID=39774 RepID=UPI0012F693FA|nr:hypothetical protein [Methylomicrobium agile]
MEYGFLYEAFAHRQSSAEEDMVYETIEWKDAVAEERVANQLVRFAQPCLNALSQESGVHFLKIPDKSGWGLWFHRSQGRVLLITPVTDTTSAKAEKIVEKYRGQLESGHLTHIIRSSRRAYPAYMLADEETWVEIEKEPVANMALSPEESDVLLSVRRTEGAFPLFVNGRAGSGKSTILQYLFADLLFYYLSTPAAQLIAPPVYLTANGELLRVARSFIERILRNEATFRGSGSASLVDDNREILDEAFREFQPHLLSMVDARTRQEQFALSRRVDYSQFRKLWTEWFGMDRTAAREFGPDISWHIIRSYIKGMLSETVMDPDDYEQLPENQITVTRQTFQTVFERVWEGRYSKIAEAKGLWDDQDLARFILDNDLAKPASPAVLCDEAQDFTRIELELLLRLNLFSNRAVPPHDLSRVPFAFAGDQFQTLNPTGFRWDAIKASFVEKFIRALDPSGLSGRTELNYRELHYNYRSTPPIVRFSNGVQALRSALFKMPELRPQTPWALPQGVFPVVWFNSGDSSFWKRFKEADSFVVIVPCNEGEEAQFVRDDPILRQHIRMEDEIPQNVLSAARAKGREYQVVVVYGFGGVAPRNLMELMDSTHGGDEATKDHSLPFQYFINRLYVAVSRPKQRLIIVDDESGINALWEFANREEVTRRVIDAANRGRTVWNADPEDENAPAVEGMTMGKVEDLTRESAGDPIDNAKTFEEDGRARKDAFLLRQAALAYRSAGDSTKATECRARALELEGDHLAAAEAYLDAGFVVPEAVQCFWKVGKTGWQRLTELGKLNASVARETEFKYALAILDTSVSSSRGIELLEELAARLSETSFAAYVSSENAWRDGINTIIDNVRNDASLTMAGTLEHVLEKIEACGIAQLDRKMAEVHFRAGSLQKAVQRWEKAGETKSDEYLKAKAAIEPYPGKLAALMKVGAFVEIIQEFEARTNTDLDSAQWSNISLAYLQCNRLNDALDAAWKSQNATVIRRIALKAISEGEAQTAIRALHGTVIAMVGNGEWEPLAKFASTLDFSPDSNWSEDAVRELVESHADELQCTLVSALARSDAFPELPGHLQRQLSEFLRRFLRVKEGRWRPFVSAEEAGAAIERGGKFTDALPFYEAVTKESLFSEEQKQFARLRWIICKNRQLEYEREQAGQSRRASEIQRELSEAMKRLGIERVTDLPKYPELAEIEKPTNSLVQIPESKPETPLHLPSEVLEADTMFGVAAVKQIELAGRVAVKVGDFNIELSRQIGRCNFKNEQTMQTAFFNIREGQPGGEKTWQVISPIEWGCEDWKIRLSHSGAKLKISFDDLGVSLSIDQPLNS